MEAVERRDRGGPSGTALGDVVEDAHHGALGIGLGDDAERTGEVRRDALGVGGHEHHRDPRVARQGAGHLHAGRAVDEVDVHECHVRSGAAAERDGIRRAARHADADMAEIFQKTFQFEGDQHLVLDDEDAQGRLPHLGHRGSPGLVSLLDPTGSAKIAFTGNEPGRSGSRLRWKREGRPAEEPVTVRRPRSAGS
ncbi:hypothetical protein GCM10025880_16150 [Methylorubrum aminovorans]|nr:hypothetical protein GCM10025880_16150 [Methylorubrum aminovorans]